MECLPEALSSGKAKSVVKSFSGLEPDSSALSLNPGCSGRFEEKPLLNEPMDTSRSCPARVTRPPSVPDITYEFTTEVVLVVIELLRRCGSHGVDGRGLS